MEFVDENSVQNAVLLNDSLFRGRQLKVNAKRTNVPGFNKGGKGGKKGAPKGKGKGKGKSVWGVSYAPVKGWGKAKGKGYAPY